LAALPAAAITGSAASTGIFALKRYDRSSPLVFIHIPKTGGVSVREMFSRWYGRNLLLHYDNPAGRFPSIASADAPEPARPLAVFGHFNARRGFGVERNYPGAGQFVTIFRDPWERAISGYFYRRNDPRQFPDFRGVELETHLGSVSSNMHNIMPRGCDLTNYRAIIETYFVEIGLQEQLDRSMHRIAGALGFDPESVDLPVLNRTGRDLPAPEHLKPKFMERHRLDYAIHDYVRSRYE
jgi:hypothetical protein